MRFLRWLQLSLRVLLPAIFLAMSPLGLRAQTDGQTITQIPPGWSDAVARLASRIGNLAGTQKVISLSVKNISSLTDADVAGISQALKAELARLGYRMNDESSADTDVVVTLSEGEEGYMWVGEVGRPDAEQTEIVSVKKTNEPPPVDTNTSIVLDRKLVWQQPGRFLDFSLDANPVGFYSTLIILEPTRLNFYRSADLREWADPKAVDIPILTPKPRDVSGAIDLEGGKAFVGPAARFVQQSGMMCTGGFDHPERIQCSNWKDDRIVTVLRPKVPGHEDSEQILFRDRCDDKSIELVTGNGDFTQTDYIQGYLATSLTGVAVPSGQPINFGGPVLALHGEGRQNTARAVVHNLKSGNYEGYVVTATCGH